MFQSNVTITSNHWVMQDFSSTESAQGGLRSDPAKLSYIEQTQA